MRNLTPYNLTQYNLRDQVELYVSMPSLCVMCCTEEQVILQA